MNRANNPDRKIAIVCFVVCVAAAAAAAAPYVIGMDMMQSGYALTCIAGFIAMSALIAALMYRARAAAWDRLALGQDVLAHWTYSEPEWQAFVQIEFEEESAEKRGLWLLVTVIALFIGIIFFIADPDAGRIVLLIMVGLILLLAGLAFGMPRLSYARNKRGPGEAWIAPSAVCLNGVLHTWNSMGAKLERVRLRESTPAILEIVYSSLSRAGRQDTTVRVPVPHGQEGAARQVVDYFQKPGG